MYRIYESQLTDFVGCVFGGHVGWVLMSVLVIHVQLRALDTSLESTSMTKRVSLQTMQIVSL